MRCKDYSSAISQLTFRVSITLLLLGIQTGDKLAKPRFFIAYSRLCRHCRNLAEGGCLLSRFILTLCRYFLGHVACRNLPWQGLFNITSINLPNICLLFDLFFW